MVAPSEAVNSICVPMIPLSIGDGWSSLRPGRGANRTHSLALYQKSRGLAAIRLNQRANGDLGRSC